MKYLFTCEETNQGCYGKTEAPGPSDTVPKHVQKLSDHKIFMRIISFTNFPSYPLRSNLDYCTIWNDTVRTCPWKSLDPVSLIMFELHARGRSISLRGGLMSPCL